MARKKKPGTPPRTPIAFRMPADLAVAAAKKAVRSGLSRSAYVEQLIRKDLGRASVDLETRAADFAAAAPADGSVFG